MKIINSIIILTLSIVTTTYAQYNKENLKVTQSQSSQNATLNKLQLYPVRANSRFIAMHKNTGNYVTLKEALGKKKISITERASGDVNTLLLENVSADTVIILAGEVVKGGKQDRMLAQDLILYPHSGKKDIAVYCVEHGRWQPNGSQMSFNGYSEVSSNEVRKAARVSKDQGEVWDKVSSTTQKNKAETSTGTLTALQKSEDFNKELKRYKDHFQPMFKDEGDVIGIVAVSGNSILGCDMFATHDLFLKHYPNLVNSYATEAITSGSSVVISYDKVNAYVQNILNDEAKQETEIEKKGTMLKQGNKKIHLSSF